MTRRKRRRYRAAGTPLSRPATPNELWCADYKGEFMLTDRRYCYPLTITDFASRYLITCDALETTKEAYAFSVFERAFKDFGLPRAIRTDNGIPFSCPNALYGLSRLSVWWLRLGIDIERIKPGHPEQNGRHERMHLTLKTEATKPASPNFLHQQARFDDFIERYNQERPHQALGMKVPGEVYTPSPRPYQGLGELDYPFHDWTATVTRCGRICSHRKKINVSIVFAGQNVGVKRLPSGGLTAWARPVCEIRHQLVPSLAQVGFVDDAVPIEHGSRLVPRQHHRHAFRHPGPDQIPRRCPSTIMEHAPVHACQPTRPRPGPPPAPNRHPVAVKDAAGIRPALACSKNPWRGLFSTRRSGNTWRRGHWPARTAR